MMDLPTVTSNSVPVAENQDTFFLDIPPQSIQQKEIFANNITATRKGVIVESEGVVFKDIIIQGTTGVFPGARGGANNLIPQNPFTSGGLANLTNPPDSAKGVKPETGRSTASNIRTISGYEEFLRLRQYLLRYATLKVETDGNLFLIFINEKDNQSLIVEPLEFTMNRNSKAPMQYQYKIVLRAIGTLDGVFNDVSGGASQRQGGILGVLEDIGNISANIAATASITRASLNQSSRLIQQLSQGVANTVLVPLAQTQFAMEDLRDGKNTVLALPEILQRNFNESIFGIRDDFNNTFGIASSTAFPPLKPKPGQGFVDLEAARLQSAEDFTAGRSVTERINNDNKVPVPRTSIETLRNNVNELSNNLADFVNLGDDTFNEIKGRTPTSIAEPTKIASDEEFLLLGSLAKMSDGLNTSLAANVIFESDADKAFEQAQAPFVSDLIPEDQQLVINKPRTVREIRIQRGITLERIAQLELGDATRWVEIAVLNNLKPPYLNETGGDGVKKFGDKLLIGVG